MSVDIHPGGVDLVGEDGVERMSCGPTASVTMPVQKSMNSGPREARKR